MFTVPAQQANLATLSSIKHYENLALAAGLSTHNIFVVPAGEYYRFTQDAMRYVGTVAGVVLYMAIVRGGVQSIVHNFAGLASNVAVGSSLDVITAPGDIIQVTANGATLNDDLYVDVFLERLHY